MRHKKTILSIERKITHRIEQMEKMKKDIIQLKKMKQTLIKEQKEDRERRDMKGIAS